MAQQEALQMMLSRFGQHPNRGRPRTHQITHRLVCGIGYPDCRQLASAMQPRQRQRVAAIRLDPVARLHRDQRRRYDNALLPVTGQQPVKSVAARSGLVAEVEPPATFTDPRRQLAQDLGTVLENPELSYFAPAATLSYRNTYRRLVHVQSDKNDIVHQARPPCMRLCADHPAQPSTVYMPRTGRRSLSGHRV